MLNTQRDSVLNHLRNDGKSDIRDAGKADILNDQVKLCHIEPLPVILNLIQDLKHYVEYSEGFRIKSLTE